MVYLEEAKTLKNKREEYLERYAAYIDSLTRKKVKVLIEELVKERKERGISQQEIAELTGMLTPNIARIESCKSIPTLPVLMKYASALGKGIDFNIVDEEK